LTRNVVVFEGGLTGRIRL